MAKQPNKETTSATATAKKPARTSTKKTSTQATKSSATAKTKKASTAKAETSSRKPTKASVKAAADTTKVVTMESRLQLIEKTAYYLAEQRGFASGDPVQDWIQAETRVNEMLG